MFDMPIDEKLSWGKEKRVCCFSSRHTRPSWGARRGRKKDDRSVHIVLNNDLPHAAAAEEIESTSTHMHLRIYTAIPWKNATHQLKFFPLGLKCIFLS